MWSLSKVSRHFLISDLVVSRRNFSVVRLEFGELLFRSILDAHDDAHVSRLFPVGTRLPSSSSSSVRFDFFSKNDPQEQRFYTKYKLEITDLRMIYLHSNPVSAPSKRKRFFVLRPTPLIDIDFYQCIDFNQTALAKYRTSVIGSSSIHFRII